MATHSNILAWRILWTEESGRLQSLGVPKSWTQLTMTLSHFYFQGGILMILVLFSFLVYSFNIINFFLNTAFTAFHEF